MAPMGPPLSPREIRRSGRRSVNPSSASNSKSPDSDGEDAPTKPLLSSSNSNGRNGRRPKQEDADGVPDVTTVQPSTPTVSPLRTKRKANLNNKERSVEPGEDGEKEEAPEGEEETRCVCGSMGDDEMDGGEFMIQCDTCKVWQHGICMGYESEDQLHDDDYHCELCRPDMHTELLKRHKKRMPQGARASRSHSPSHLSSKQQSKRRNTMNSRDAAFDEQIQDILKATAAEAVGPGAENAMDVDEDAEIASKRKRRRTEEDSAPKKRSRSASMASDKQPTMPPPRDPTPTAARTSAGPSVPPLKPARGGAGARRGGKVKTASIPHTETVDVAEVSPVPVNARGKGRKGATRRPPASAIVGAGNARTNSGVGPGANNSENTRAYRNSHAYAVSQQPLYTSWNLPDYLAHLGHTLPTMTPQPLEVQSAINGRGESMERMTERGVKVKWPAKRMGVSDMNKRVRSLVEWVGREQALAHERERRRETLEAALRENRQRELGEASAILMDRPVVESPTQELVPQDKGGDQLSAMKMMEGLMEECITFQERFGPGAKGRRIVS